MSDPLATDHLGLPYIAPAQAQKHVTHNEALRRLDTVVQLAVIDSTLTDPPGAPEEGDRYIVAGPATGAWLGKEGKVAAFVDGAWDFVTPGAGWLAFDATVSAVLVHDAGAWQSLVGFLGPIDHLGINATADDTNRLAVRSGAVLFSAIEAADGGSGDVRFVVNKETDADTASLLFQSGWSGRAEVGLAGDADLVFKVSPDGSAWTEAIRIDKDSGLATILYDHTASGLSATSVQAAIDEIAAASGGVVASVFGRTGAIAAALHDYDASQVDNDSGVSGATVKDAFDGLATSLSGKQDADADLTALAGIAATGLLARTGSGAAAARTLTGPAAGIAVSNGNGVSGNPTLALANDLAALEALSGTGIVKRTGTDTWTTGAGVTDLAATTANRLFGTDGSGNAGIVTLPAAGLTLSAGALAPANDLAAYEGLVATGLVARTADGSAAARTLTAPATGITVSNGDGVSGNPTLALANDLSALEALASTGIAARTASDTWAQRSIAGTTNRISVSNGSGAAGDPTVDISAAYAGQTSITTLGTIATGTWAGTTVSVDHGGTGQTSYTDGQLLIGNSTGNTLAKGSLTAPAAGLTITGGAGSITFALANDLGALEALSSTGIAARTATDTWAQRSIAAATGLSVANGSGAAGNPTVSLDINSLTEDTTPDATADFWLTYDASAAGHKKVKPTSLVRERLGADRTYYVRTDGSDSNTGLANTSGGAFLTVQKAINVIFGNLDLAGFNVDIQLADGTYTGAVSIATPQVGAGTITVRGNNAAPANVVINPTLSGGSAAFYVGKGAALTLKDFELRTTSNGHGIRSDQGGFVTFQNLRFGPIVQYNLVAQDGGHITASGNYAIVGGSVGHYNAQSGATIRDSGTTVTLSGTPAFSLQFAYAQLGATLLAFSQTYSGSATGARYKAESNGQIFTNGGGASYFPGNAAGSTATGGQYL